jgi:NAD(P)-dependent dehydrogenase (short-subunit alcohol dehydrogenase family)
VEYRSIEQGMAGKAALITGGTSGIGRACVQVFCRAGINVMTIGRNVAKGEALVAELNKEGKGRCIYQPCDVKDTDRLQEIVEQTVLEFGRLDVLVNCAGYFPAAASIDDVSKDMYMDVIQTNLTPYFMCSQFALPHIRKTRGAIVNIGSVVATTGGSQCQAYCCTKGAIEAFTRSLAIDEARNGVRVNEVKPGHINTEIFEQMVSRQVDKENYLAYFDHVQVLGRGGQPEEVAYAVLFMASDWASFITGTELMVSGGYELGEGANSIFTPIE